MDNKVIMVPVGNADMAARERQIKEILSRGKIVRLQHVNDETLWKDVNEWNADSDEHRDLKAFRTSPNAQVPYVCWATDHYKIIELDQ